MVEFVLVLESYGIGGDQQVGPVAPAFQEPPKVLPAQLVPLVVVQLRPLAVFVADQRQAGVRDHPETFVLELEAIIDVQVTVEPEAFPH